MTYKFFALCLMFVVTLPNGFAQSKDEKMMAAAVERLRNAMIAADVATLNELTAPELSYGHSNGKIDTKAEFVGDLQSGKSDFEPSPYRIKPLKLSEKLPWYAINWPQMFRITGRQTALNYPFSLFGSSKGANGYC